MSCSLTTTATVHLDMICAYFSDDADLVHLLQTSKAMRERLTHWRHSRLQTIQWWPLRLDGTSLHAKETQLRALGVSTLQQLPAGWGIVLRKLHARFHTVNPTPAVFDASLQGRLRPIHRIRDGESDHDEWVDDEGSDAEAYAEAKKRDRQIHHSSDDDDNDDDDDDDDGDDEESDLEDEEAKHGEHVDTKYLLRELPRIQNDASPAETIVALLEFGTRLAASDWNITRSCNKSECFDWLSRWLWTTPGMEAWLTDGKNMLPSAEIETDTFARVLRLMLFGVVLHYQNDAPWCTDWGTFQYASMVPVYACPILARLVSRLPCFRAEGKFVSFMVEAIIFPDGQLGWGKSVNTTLFLDREHELDSRIDRFMARLPACIDTYWAEFSRHKAYRMWIKDYVQTSTEYNAFEEWLSGEHTEHFPLEIEPEEWTRWKLWLQLAVLVDPDGEFLDCLGCDKTHRPDLNQPCIIHADGSSEALPNEPVWADGDRIGYPFVSTPEERATAFALRIQASSSTTPIRFRRYAWQEDDPTRVDVHDIQMSVVARIVPGAYEAIDTWFEWTEKSSATSTPSQCHVRVSDIDCTNIGRLKKTSTWSAPTRANDPREIVQPPIVDWERCVTCRVIHDKYEAWLPASCKRILYFECIDSPEAFQAWCKLNHKAETHDGD
jgi:hypothetical protein